MLPKGNFQYLRRSFEKFVETKLEASIWDEKVTEIVLDILTCEKELEILTFSAKEVELVVKELEKKGYKVDDQKTEAEIVPGVKARKITIWTR